MVQEVRVVGGSEWWEAPLIAAVATFVVAVVAAWTAEHRLTKQLATDLKINDDKLSYDRQERNRDHVRDAMDDCVRGIRDALLVLQAYEEAVVGGAPSREATRLVARAPKTGFDMRQESARQDLIREVQALGPPSAPVAHAPVNLKSDNFRLQVRLGREHTVVTNHQEFINAYANRSVQLKELHNRAMTDEEKTREARGGGNWEVNARFYAFVDACQQWLTPEEPEVPPTIR
jgi:hypothetical protein